MFSIIPACVNFRGGSGLVVFYILRFSSRLQAVARDAVLAEFENSTTYRKNVNPPNSSPPALLPSFTMAETTVCSPPPQKSNYPNFITLTVAIAMSVLHWQVRVSYCILVRMDF